MHVALELTPEQARAYRIADNKTADLATWNLELLPGELAELQARMVRARGVMGVGPATGQQALVQLGVTMQALVSATGDAARCHDKAGQFGTLTPGAAADLLILGANPLQDIRNSRTIEQVWLNGARAF